MSEDGFTEAWRRAERETREAVRKMREDALQASGPAITVGDALTITLPDGTSKRYDVLASNADDPDRELWGPVRMECRVAPDVRERADEH